MLPKQAHDVVLQNVGNEVKYEETMERVRTFVAHMVVMTSGSGPISMDVGHAHAENCGEWGDEENWDEEDVGEVSMNTQYHGCHGWRHVRRDCPAAAANSKGAHKGKRNGKGTMKGAGKARSEVTETQGHATSANSLATSTGIAPRPRGPTESTAIPAQECRGRSAAWARGTRSVGGIWALGADVATQTNHMPQTRRERTTPSAPTTTITSSNIARLAARLRASASHGR